MKKLSIVLLILAFVAVCFGSAIAADNGPQGPAPNSGDCNPDGSGFDGPNGPNTDGPGVSGQGPKGPAPNSGDGVPDGSGF